MTLKLESQTIFGMNQLVSGEKLVQRTQNITNRYDWLLRKSTNCARIFTDEYSSYCLEMKLLNNASPYNFGILWIS